MYLLGAFETGVTTCLTNEGAQNYDRRYRMSEYTPHYCKILAEGINEQLTCFNVVLQAEKFGFDWLPHEYECRRLLPICCVFLIRV